jgi:LmbE family N-acetylglucosaminyl deacetylase
MNNTNKLASRIAIAFSCAALLISCSSPAARKDERAPVLLAVFAHPDDESTVSAVLAKYAAAGVHVYLATATDGRLGVAAHAGTIAGDSLAATRADELKCTTEKIGINPPIMFGLYDQLKMGEGLQPHMAQLAEMRDRVTRLFEELQPDAVITWGPSGWTGHPDHRLVSDIVTEVFQSRTWSKPAQLYYPAVPTGKVPADNPIPLATVDERFLSVKIRVTPADYEKSKAGWLCHRTQYTPEQVEQLYQSLVAAQGGIAHFQPLVTRKGKRDSLL